MAGETPEVVAGHRCHGGVQAVYRHASRATGTSMAFSIYLPPAAETGRRCPVLWWLSGLTCTWENATTKAGFQGPAAAAGMIVVCPDTSPRGLDLPDEHAAYDFGSGAGFYLDATVEPWSGHYRMATYVTRELQDLVAASFPIDTGRQGIAGHSMGGHGALTLALKHPGLYRSVSAFAPICSPMRCPWGERALSGYLGSESDAWRAHDATALIEDGHRVPEILVDQGLGDTFLADQLKPELLEAACSEAGIPLELRRQPDYDHSYYFMQSFMADHVAWHADRL
jgi:S-formylglutathione hydrolase